MTASVAKSPTLLPFDKQNNSEVPLPSSHRLGTSPRSPSKGAPTFVDLYQLHKKRSNQHLTPRGLDSTDIEAQRQEQEKALAASNNHSSKAATAAAPTPTTPSQLNEEKAIAATAAELDPQGPFEGPEKLLELWFAECPDTLPVDALRDQFTILQDADGNAFPGAQPRERLGLRAVPRALWEGMLDIVKCKVLSVIEGHDVDAYLLSESSMFVFPHKIILKTCGTTTLLLGLQRLLELARCAMMGAAKAPFPSPIACAPAEPYNEEQPEDESSPTSRKKLGSLVQQCFYSRKSFMFPERQKGPHKDWMLEVRLLDAFLEDGSAYTVGKMNGDHWLLYMCCPGDDAADAHGANGVCIERPLRLPGPASQVDVVMDRTLEILMTHLTPKSCAAFEFPPDAPLPPARGGEPLLDRGHLLGMDLSDKLGLSTLFPKTELDAFAFEPCGYSANAVIPASAGSTAGYWTIHVTPEEGSSYASFETNVALTSKKSGTELIGGDGAPRDLATLISRVVDIFEPGEMSVTLFISSRDVEDEEGGCHTKDDGSVLHSLNLPGYARKDRIAYEFEHYDLVFCHFEAKVGRRA